MVDWHDFEKVGPPPGFCDSTPKPNTMGWLVFDGTKLSFCTVHPTWWNLKHPDGEDLNGPVVTHWAEVEPPMSVNGGEG